MPTGVPDPHRHLVADIGGTHTRFALCASVSTIEKIRVLNSADFDNLEHAIAYYLQRVGKPPVRNAVIGIANPVVGDHIKMTNGPWEFSIEQTRQNLGLDSLRVINDFTALAMSLPHLPAAELEQIGGHVGATGTPLALLGPGTGLGVSALIPTPEGVWTPLAGEGGHVGFAPSDELEGELWRLARQQYGHASLERLLSGPGLQFIYRSVCALNDVQPQNYAPEQISGNAINGPCPQCRQALDAFCAILGTAASDLALMLGARGGVYIGGGIVSRLVDYVRQSAFRSRFEAKGRFAEYLAAIPVFVVTSAYPGLICAAAYLEALEET
jgi:glucokinase